MREISWNNDQPEQCRDNLKEFFSINRGIFYGDNPLQRLLPFIMIRLSMFFILSIALRHFLKPLKQTEYVCNLLIGIILGPSVLGRYMNHETILNDVNEVHFINLAAYIGVIYYIFTICVKINFDMLRRTHKKDWVIGMSTLLAPLSVMVVLNKFLRSSPFQNRYYAYLFCMQLSCTLFTNLAPMLEELNLLTTEIGQLAMSAATTNEFLLWCFWIANMLYNNTMGRGILSATLQFVTIASTLCVLRLVMYWVVKRIPEGQTVKEIYIVGVMLGVGIMGCVTDVLTGSTVFGVVCFGLIIPNGPPLGSSIISRTEVFIKYCLLPFFYFGIGDMTNIYEIRNAKEHLTYQLTITAGYLTKTTITTLVAMLYNMTLAQSFALGLIMNTSGVVHIVVYWGFWLRKTLDTGLCSHLVLSSMFVTSLVIPLALKFYVQRVKLGELVGGFGLSIQAASPGSTLDILACIDSEEDVPSVATLLKVSNPAESTTMCGYLVHLTELVGQVAPMLSLHKKHKRICGHNGCIHITSALKNYCDNNFKGSITLRFLTIVAPFTTIHESVCKLAKDKMIPLIIIPSSYTSQRYAREKVICVDLIRKLQEKAPCTVGIILDKDIDDRKREQACFAYKVVVIFVGGEDDREALTYAIKISKHPGVSITLLRITIQHYKDMNKDDKEFDKSLVDFFKTMMITNANLSIQEFDIQDWPQAIHIIGSLNNDFDLVMVGRRHSENTKINKDVYVFSEYLELGSIGEMLITTKFQWTTVSILVMQYCVDVGN